MANSYIFKYISCSWLSLIQLEAKHYLQTRKKDHSWALKWADPGNSGLVHFSICLSHMFYFFLFPLLPLANTLMSLLCYRMFLLFLFLSLSPVVTLSPIYLMFLFFLDFDLLSQPLYHVHSRHQDSSSPTFSPSSVNLSQLEYNYSFLQLIHSLRSPALCVLPSPAH